MPRITRPQSLPPCRRGCTGWCGRCCPGNGSGRRSCCCGWRIRSYATSGRAAPTRDAAPPAVKAGWSHHLKRVVGGLVMGVREIDRSLEQWQMGVKDLRRRMILGSHTPGAGAVVHHPAAGAGLDGSGHGGGSGKGPARTHTPSDVGRQPSASEDLQSPDIRADRWFPPALGEAQREELKEAAVQRLPADIGHRTWPTGTGRWCIGLSGNAVWHSACAAAVALNYLHRLGFAFKRPKKLLLKADAKLNGRPSWWSTPHSPTGADPADLAARYSLLTRPTSGPMRSCGASGC